MKRWSALCLLGLLVGCGGSSGPGEAGSGDDDPTGEDAGTFVDGGGGAEDGGLDAGNLPPTFAAVADLTVAEDSPVLSVGLSGVSSGSAAEDLTQTVTVQATSSDPSLVSPGTVSGQGALRLLELSLGAHRSGSATVTLEAEDGVGGSFRRTFQVTVTPLNDAPMLASPGPQRVAPGASLDVTLTGIGPGGGADEASQPLSLQATVEPPSLLQSLTPSAVFGDTAQLSLVASSAGGAGWVTVTLSDGASANGSTQVTFPLLVSSGPPQLSGVAVASGTLQGCVPVDFVLIQPESLPAELRLEVDTGAGYRPASVQAAPLGALSSSPSGVSHSLVWRSNVDVPGAQASGVKLRLTAQTAGLWGTPVELAGLVVDDRLSLGRKRFSAGPGPFQAVLADLDQDGWTDVISPDSFSNTTSVMRGLSDGGFESPVAHVTSPPSCGSGSPPKPFSVNVSDQNKDGWLDLLVVHENCNTIGLHLSNGMGGFAPYVLFPVGGNPLFGSVADFNHDGHPDYAVVNYLSNDVSLLAGQPDGGFAPEVRFATGINPNKIEAADFDNDGWPDLVTADPTDDRVAVLLNARDGGFQTHRDFDAGVGPRNLGVGDLNHDGRVDVVTANAGPTDQGTTCSVLLQTEAGGFEAPAIYPVQLHPRAVGIGDVNGDDHLDFAVANVGSDSISLLLGRGDGTFHAAQHFAVGAGPHSVVMRDLDADGRVELVTGDSFEGSFSVLSNQTPVCAP